MTGRVFWVFCSMPRATTTRTIEAHYQSVMKILFLLPSLLASSYGWSYQNLQRQANMIAQTRRDPIQMPTQTPMVPYKVSNALLCYLPHRRLHGCHTFAHALVGIHSPPSRYFCTASPQVRIMLNLWISILVCCAIVQ